MIRIKILPAKPGVSGARRVADGFQHSAPLQATHQELALANAHDLSQYVALSYFGVPGLTVGSAISTGKAVSVPSPSNAPIAGSQRVTLWEGHVRWTPAKFDLSALYARGTISNLAATSAPGDYGLWPRNYDRVWTVGANLYVTPHVVLKVDYQHFQINDTFTRIDLGLGLNF